MPVYASQLFETCASITEIGQLMIANAYELIDSRSGIENGIIPYCKELQQMIIACITCCSSVFLLAGMVELRRHVGLAAH